MYHVLLAGATGYLGGFIAKALLSRGYTVTLVVRHPDRLDEATRTDARVITGDLRDPATWEGAFEAVDAVISTVGITRQRDGLHYMDVDYGINRQLLDAAERRGVRKFVYVSVLHGDKLRHVALCAAKERFVDALRRSPVPSTVIRPGGFFSDMNEFVTMAKRGRIYLFGDGSLRTNPIHGADLAALCVDALHLEEKVIEAGGPEVLTHREIAEKAFEAIDAPVKITGIPDVVRRIALRVLPWVMGKTRFGPVEFFLHVMAMEMTAPLYGQRTLGAHFRSL